MATDERYAKLAQKNTAHYAPSNPKLVKIGTSGFTVNHKTMWEKHYTDAIRFVSADKKNKALATNAFTDHFLTNAFVSGHLINKPDVMDEFTINLKKHGKSFFDNVAKNVFADKKISTFLSKYETVKWKGYVFHPNLNSASRFSKLLQGIHDKELVFFGIY